MAVEAAVAPRGRSKALGVALWAAILLIVAALIAGVVFVQRYQPLQDGTIAGISRDTKEIDTYGDVPVHVLTPWAEGSTFFAGFTLYNDGPVTITVQRILDPHQLGIDGEPGQGFEPVNVVVGPDERYAGQIDTDYEKYTEFAPFELDPDAERRVAIEYRLNSCLRSDETMSDDSVTVAFSIWRMSRDMDVALPYRLAADGKYRQGC